MFAATGLRDQVRGWVARRRAEAEKHQDEVRSPGDPDQAQGRRPTGVQGAGDREA